MKCKWYAAFEGVCTNGDCPYRGDTCPTSEHPEVCKYAEEAQEPRLNAEELATALRICAGSECEGCPLAYGAEFGANCEKYVKRKAADMLEKLAAEKDEKKPEWISVNDRLPDSNNVVFACIDDGQCKIVRSAYVSSYGKWKWIEEHQTVTHWMPLPEPPKEEEHEKVQ